MTDQSNPEEVEKSDKAQLEDDAEGHKMRKAQLEDDAKSHSDKGDDDVEGHAKIRK